MSDRVFTRGFCNSMTGLPFLFNLPVFNGRGHDVVRGQQELHAARLGLCYGGLGDFGQSGSTSDLPGLEALRELERVSHRAADEDSVGLIQQTVDDLDLVRNFGAAEDDDKGAGRVSPVLRQEISIPAPSASPRRIGRRAWR